MKLRSILVGDYTLYTWLELIREGFGGSSCPKELRTRQKNNIFDPYFCRATAVTDPLDS